MIDLHLGAHKTASTLLQGYMAGLNNVLERHGATFYQPVKPYGIREEIVSPVVRMSHVWRKTGRWPQVEEVCQKKIGDIRSRSNINHVVLSDENFIGNCEQIHASRVIYPHVIERLSSLRRVLWESPARIYLCIRDFYGFIPSAYSESIRHRPYLSFPEYVSMLECTDLSWSKVVSDIQSVFPDSNVVLWEFSQLSSIARPLLVDMFGEAVALGITPMDTRVRQRASITHKGVEVLDHLAGVASPEEIKKMVHKVEQVFSSENGYSSFRPWPEKKELLDRVYQEDLARLRRMDRVRFLSSAA